MSSWNFKWNLNDVVAIHFENGLINGKFYFFCMVFLYGLITTFFMIFISVSLQIIISFNKSLIFLQIVYQKVKAGNLVHFMILFHL